jgi:hypothetical protein
MPKPLDGLSLFHVLILVASGKRATSVKFIRVTCSRLTFLTRPGRWFVCNLRSRDYLLPTYLVWKDVTNYFHEG